MRVNDLNEAQALKWNLERTQQIKNTVKEGMSQQELIDALRFILSKMHTETVDRMIELGLDFGGYVEPRASMCDAVKKEERRRNL